MTVRRLATAWMIAVVPLACTPSGIPGPPSGLTHAAARPSCGPADGPAIEIYLTPTPLESSEPPTPYVRVYIWQSLEQLADRPWVVGGDSPSAAAWHHSTARDYVVATSGVVRVNAVRADKAIEGSADLRFGSDRRVRGGFRAVWLPRAMLCG